MSVRFISLLFFLCILFAVNSNAQKPNVILINMDDMGYGDTEPYGSTGYATPNFNKLAKEGMRFTHFYAASGSLFAFKSCIAYRLLS